MLTIYTVPVSTYTAKLRVTLRHKGLEWEELPPPGGYGSAAYKAIVPSGNIPAMVHDGFMLADSEAIAEYLNEAFPAVPMLPADLRPRAKAREFGRLHDTRLEPNVRAMFPQVRAQVKDPEAIRAGGELISKSLAALALLLASSPLPEDQLWLCDAGFAVTFEWMALFERDLGLPIDWPDSVRAYQARLHGFAAVSSELSHYRPAMEAYMAKPAV